MILLLRSALAKRLAALALFVVIMILLFHYYKDINKIEKNEPKTKLDNRLTEMSREKIHIPHNAPVVSDIHPPSPIIPDNNKLPLPAIGGQDNNQMKPPLSSNENTAKNLVNIDKKLTPKSSVPESIKTKPSETQQHVEKLDALPLSSLNNHGNSVTASNKLTAKGSDPGPVDKKSVENPQPVKQAYPGHCVNGRNKAKEAEWAALDVETSKQTSQSSQEHAEHVKQMMLHTWNNYKKYAWGANELAPIVKRPHSGVFSGTKMGLSIVDSLDTMWMMGEFGEVEEGKLWLINNLAQRLNVSVEVSVFEFNIRFVGGLLSMFALTNECEYRTMAILCADKLVPAFQTTHGIPVSHVNLKHGYNNKYGQYGSAVLAEFGTLHLEFVYLSNITGDDKYKKLVDNIRNKVEKASVNGLYGNNLNIDTAKYNEHSMTVSLGGAGDSFYEYLFKSYLQSGKRDTHALKLYFNSIDAILRAGMLKTSRSGLKYFGIKNTGSSNVMPKMEHLACFIGGLMGISAEYSSNKTFTLKVAEDIANTCHESYIRAESGIGPESFNFGMGGEAISVDGDKGYHMRPEVVETWFFLSRVTQNRKYKEWCWDFIEALDKFCRVEGGYAGLTDVYLKRRDRNGNPLLEDVQQSYFMAETLKYLYLIYKDKALLPLDKWVFNTEAHPLPVL